MKPEFDAYQELINLIKFANAADQHLKNLMDNEKHLISAINAQFEKIESLTKRIQMLELENTNKSIEEKQNETT